MFLLQSQGSCPLRIGPFGSCVGRPFDEGVNGGIREVHLCHSKLGVHCIATVDDKGLPKAHCISSNLCDCSMVSLSEGETVDSITGTYGIHIYSLTMATSLGRRYGPYGCPSLGRPFGFSGPILGFFGHCDNFLRAVGCYSDIYKKS